MNFSDFLEQSILGATLLGSTYTSPATVYAALATSLSTVGSEVTFTEVLSGLGYGRQTMQFSDVTSSPNWSVVTSTTMTWSPATTPWGGVVALAIWDAETIGGGNLLYWGEPTAVRSVATGNVYQISAGNLSVRLD